MEAGGAMAMTIVKACSALRNWAQHALQELSGREGGCAGDARKTQLNESSLNSILRKHLDIRM